MQEAGDRLAQEVIALSRSDLATLTPALESRLVDIELPFETPPDAGQLQSMLDDQGAGVSEDRKSWATDMLNRLQTEGSLPTAVPIGLHLLRLGPELRFVGLEGELGSELGNMIARSDRNGLTCPLGYTNGSRINIPCNRQLPEGGYGVDTFWEYHWPARLAPGIDERIHAAVQQETR